MPRHRSGRLDFAFAAMAAIVLATAACVFIYQIAGLSPSGPESHVEAEFWGIAFTMGGWLAGYIGLFLVLVMGARTIYRVITQLDR